MDNVDPDCFRLDAYTEVMVSEGSPGQRGCLFFFFSSNYVM